MESTLRDCQHEIQQLQQSLAEAEHLINETPTCNTLVPPWFQRLWEACVNLVDKADFKILWKHMQWQEGEIQKLLQQLADSESQLKEALKISARVVIAPCTACREESLFWSVSSSMRCERCKAESQRQALEREVVRLKAESEESGGWGS
jgi:flavorubredoxin